MHATVWYHPRIVLQVRHDVGPCVKSGSFFVEPEVKSQWTVLVGYLTISTKYVSCYHVLHILTSQKKEQHQHQRKIISFLLSYGPNITHLLLVT